MLEAALIIEGARVVSCAGSTFERRDPVTGRVLTRAVAAGTDDAERAADSAAAAFPGWSGMPGDRRAALLIRAAEEIRRAAGRWPNAPQRNWARRTRGCASTSTWPFAR